LFTPPTGAVDGHVCSFYVSACANAAVAATQASPLFPLLIAAASEGS